MKIKKILVLGLCLSFAIGFSQKKDRILKKANTKYEEFSFIEARKLYAKLIEKGYSLNEVYGRLGDTYFFNSDYANALIWYEKLMEAKDEVAAEYNLRYSICLRANDQYNESFAVLEKYYESQGDADEVEKWNPEKFAEQIEKQSGRYTGVAPAGLNSNLSGFGVALVPDDEAYKQKIDNEKLEKRRKLKALKIDAQKRRIADAKPVTDKKLLKKIKKNTIEINSAHAEKQEVLPKYKEVMYAASEKSWGKKHKWDKKTFSKMYVAKITEDGMLEDGKKLSGSVNEKYSVSTPAITKDGLTMYFTRLVPYFDEAKKTDRAKSWKKSLKEKKNEISQLRIYQAKKKNNKWGDVSQLSSPINIVGSSSAHPALSPNEDLLYFVSNRDKSLNDTDLYVIKRRKRGGFYGKAEALGTEINTLGRETFPFVDSSGILYFSSDGHPGMGGLDVFAAVKDKAIDKYLTINVGEPINSKGDDFGYSIDGDSKKGFFSSNRINGPGNDDVYKFVETKPIDFPFKREPVYSGIVKDSISGELMNGGKITVYNDEQKIIKTLTANEKGRFSVDLPPFKKYNFEFSMENYQIKKIAVPGLELSETKEMLVELLPESVIIVDGKVINLKNGDNLAQTLKLKALYFDFGGYSIRKSTTYELDKVINLLAKNPKVYVAIHCHTDSRGRDDYNLQLSKNRAKTAVNYIVNVGGISADRITGVGYGETKLLNKCSNGEYCSEQEHEANRRTDFIVEIKK